MTYLSRDDILKPRELKVEELDVPELGGIVRVSELSGTARDAYEESMVRVVGDNARPDFSNRRAKLVVLALVNEDGEPMLSPVDVDLLGKLPAHVLVKLAEVAERLSGLNEDEDAEGNSEAAPGGGSISS